MKIRIWSMALVATVVFLPEARAAGRVKVWELPAGKEIEAANRDGWKEAGADAACPAGGVLENKHLLVVVRPGESGPLVISKSEGSEFRLRLELPGADGAASKLSAVAPGKSDRNAASLSITAGGIKAEVKLGVARHFVEVRPGEGAAALDIVAPSRFVMMPDFFTMDMGFDARRMKGEKTTALADNFYLHMVDGGSAIVMPVWPGVKPGEAREESTVDLFLEEEGEGRRFARGRVAFEKKKPVYVAVLEGKGYWHLEDVSSWEAAKAGKSSWQRPFDARWRGSMFAKEGKLCGDWNVAILSDYFPEPKPDPKDKRIKNSGRGLQLWDEMLKKVVWWPKDGVPLGNAQGLWSYKRHCWFVDKDTYLYPYVAQGVMKGIANKNKKEQQKARKAKKEGKEYTPQEFKPENDFETAIIYPMDRAEATPVDVYVPVDVIRDTLGMGPCEYIMDKEGLTRVFHGGKEKMHFEGATCGNWSGRLAPLLKKWQKDGKLSDKDKQDVVWLIEDMGTFISAVNVRFHAYADFHSRVEKLLKEAGTTDEGVKAFVAAVSAQLGFMKKMTERAPRFDKELAKWKKSLETHMQTAKDATECPKSLNAVGRVRQFAQQQDTGIAVCRRCVNAIRQAVGLALAGQGSPETAKLAAAVREECRKILRNPHPLEGY